MPVHGDRWVIKRIEKRQEFWLKNVTMDQVKAQVFTWSTDESQAMVFSSIEAAERMKKLAHGYGRIVRKGVKDNAAIHEADHKIRQGRRKAEACTKDS